MSIQTNQLRACDVHRLVDFDCAIRDCSYCKLCDAWICQECLALSVIHPRRIKAAMKRVLEPGYVGLPNYVEVAKGEANGREGTNH